MEKITSLQNERVKQWKKLLTAKGRKKSNSYLVEGWHLVEEAKRCGDLLECIATKEAIQKWQLENLSIKVVEITQEIANTLAETITSQAVFGVVQQKNEWVPLTGGKYILLDALQDPGNVGTIIRTADALGFSGVIVGEGSVDIYNSKTLRSMQGSQFHLPIYKMDLLVAIEQLQELAIPVYATSLNKQAMPLHEVSIANECAIIVGNEGNGVQSKHLMRATQSVYIAMAGQAESLNVAVASGIAMYHFALKK